jgi:hypothetical protein
MYVVYGMIFINNSLLAQFTPNIGSSAHKIKKYDDSRTMKKISSSDKGGNSSGSSTTDRSSLKTDKEKYNTKKNENKVLYKYYH